MALFRFGLTLDGARRFARGTTRLFPVSQTWVGYEKGDTLVMGVWEDRARHYVRGAVFRIVLAKGCLLQDLEGMSFLGGAEEQLIEELLGRSLEAFRASWDENCAENLAHPNFSWDDNPRIYALLVERIEDAGPKFDYLCDPELEAKDLPEDPPEKSDAGEGTLVSPDGDGDEPIDFLDDLVSSGAVVPVVPSDE